MKQKELIFYLDGKEFKQSQNSFVPFDEGMINRGLSIFDAIKFYNGIFIDIDAHLERTYDATKVLGAPLEKIFHKKEFKEKLERLKKVIIKCFSKDMFLKLEIITSRQFNVFLRVVPVSIEWLNPQKHLVMAAIQYKYLLQNLKYCGRYAEPMIIAQLAKQQVDSEIEECLFYYKTEKNGKAKYMTLEATNSAFFVIDSKNRLWCATPPNVLPSTTYKIIGKVAKLDINNSYIPEKERISAIMPLGFPINTPGYKIKEMFSTSAIRLLPLVKKLIFVDIKNDGLKIIVERNKKIKDVIIDGGGPITERLRKGFQNELKQYIQLKNRRN